MSALIVLLLLGWILNVWMYFWMRPFGYTPTRLWAIIGWCSLPYAMFYRCYPWRTPSD